MDATNWAGLFQAWPTDVPRRGVLITSWNEQVPFDGFLASPSFLVVFRQTPDSLGARTILLPFENLAGLKFTDVVKLKAFLALGFEGSSSQR